MEPKFFVACALPSSKKKEIISVDDDEDVQDVDPDVKKCPMGRNSMKWKMDEVKILVSVSKQIESGATTSLQLADALQEIAKCTGSAISNWQMQLAIPNASPDLIMMSS